MVMNQPKFAPTGLDTYAVMALCAQDATSFFDEIKNSANSGGPPNFPPLNAKNQFGYLQNTTNWKMLGQLRADDDILLGGQNCYFGLVMQCLVREPPFKPGDILVAIKGTSDLREWLDDVASIFEVHGAPNTPGDVADGFWKIYLSLKYQAWPAPGAQPSAPVDVVSTICAMLGKGALYVVGHSLGAALATYLTYDLAEALDKGPDKLAQLMPYFFASPKTGTDDNVANYRQWVPFYNLANYQNDLVPKLPFESEGFSDLLSGGPMHNVMTLHPNGESYIPHFWDVAQNHSATLYALLLDPTNPIARRLQGLP